MSAADLFLTSTQTLAPTASRLAHLLSALDARLEIVAPSLQFTQDALSSHLALEMFDCPLDALVTDLNFEGPT
jgi:hypothetical protein